ncbi:MAG TPA: hypothetical protein ENI15_13555 [Spirochaetes bacterium]|nr:hypothetical protein [Spirochaetota bacterium]
MKKVIITLLIALMTIMYVSCIQRATIRVWNEGGDVMTVDVEVDSRTINDTQFEEFEIEWVSGPFQSHDVHVSASYSGATRQGGRYITNVEVYNEGWESLTITNCPGWY